MILDPNGMPILQPTVDNAETATFNDAFAAIGNAVVAVENAVVAVENVRQIQTYKWADNAARTAQTGMGAGDEGYQTDTDTYYIYDGTSWKGIPTPTNVVGTVDLVGDITATSATITRVGNVVDLTIVGAQRAGAWTSGVAVASIGPAAFLPPSSIPITAFGGGSGLSHPSVISASNQILMFGNTSSGSAGRTTFHGTWIVN